MFIVLKRSSAEDLPITSKTLGYGAWDIFLVKDFRAMCSQSLFSGINHAWPHSEQKTSDQWFYCDAKPKSFEKPWQSLLGGGVSSIWNSLKSKLLIPVCNHWSPSCDVPTCTFPENLEFGSWHPKGFLSSGKMAWCSMYVFPWLSLICYFL